MLDGATAREAGADGLAAAVGAGVDWMQLRDRELPGDELLELTDALLGAARPRGARVIVNRRIDVALAAGADGVQLGFDAVEPAVARALLGDEALLGVSCHAADEVQAAEGASYAQLAPIFPPLSKAATRPPLGLGALREAAGARPLLAQGGIDADNAGACLAAGAAGVAVSGAIGQAQDPGRAAAALRRALDAGAAR